MLLLKISNVEVTDHVKHSCSMLRPASVELKIGINVCTQLRERCATPAQSLTDVYKLTK